MNWNRAKRYAYFAVFTLQICSGTATAQQHIINTTPVLTTADDDDAIAIFEPDSSIINESLVTTHGISADALRIDGLGEHPL